MRDRRQFEIPINDIFSTVFILLIAVIVMRGLLNYPGVIGLRDDWNIGAFPSQIYQMILEQLQLYSWNKVGVYGGMGSQIYILPQYLYAFVLTFFYVTGQGGEVVSKGLVFLAIAWSGLAMYYSCKILKFGSASAFISALFYMLSPVVYNRIGSGHFTYLFSYVLTPLLLVCFIKSVGNDKPNYKMSVLTGLIVGLAFAEPRWFLTVLALLFVYSLVTKKVRAHTNSLLIVFTIAVLIQLPTFAMLVSNYGKAYSMLALPTRISSESWEFLGNVPIENALRLLGYVPPFFERGVGLKPYSPFMSLKSEFMFEVPVDVWTLVSFLIPLIAFSTLLLKSRDRNVLFLVLISIISLFFAKGISPPFGETLPLLMSNFPMLSVFRGPYHFSSFLSLAYAMLLGVFFKEFPVRKLSSVFSEGFKLSTKYLQLSVKLLFPPRAFRVVIATTLLVIILLNSWPFLIGDFSNQIQTYVPKNEDYETFNRFNFDQGDFRVLLLPSVWPIQYNNSTIFGIDPLLMYFSKPQLSSDANIPTPGSTYAWFIDNTFHQEKTKYIGQLLGRANVKSVIFRTHVASKYLYFMYWGRYPDIDNSYTNERIFDVLRNQDDLKEEGTLGEIYFFENTHFLPHIRSANNGIIVASDLSSIVSLSYAEPVINTTGDPLFFASQFSADDNPIDLVNTVLIQNDDYFDFVASIIPSEYKITPGKYAIHTDAEQYWVSFLDWHWYSWDYSAALENAAFSRAQDTLNIPYTSTETATHDVWTKIYFGKREGAVAISFDGTENSLIYTKTQNDEGFKWVRLPPVSLQKGKHVLNIQNIQGENVISRIVVAPQPVLNDAFERAKTLLQNKSVVLLYEFEKLRNESSENTTNLFSHSIAASQGAAVRLVNTEFATQLFVPRSGEYEVYLRVMPPLEVGQRQFANLSSVPLYNGKSIGQTFIPSASNIYSVSICLAKHEATTGTLGSITFTLWNSTLKQTKIGSVTLPTYDIPYRWSFVDFVLGANVVPNKQYYFELTATGGNEIDRYEVGTSVPPTFTFQNPGFEKGTSGWSTEGKGSFSTENVTVYDGTQSAKLSLNENENFGMYTMDTYPSLPNQVINFAAHILTDTNTKAQLLLFWYDADDTYLGATVSPEISSPEKWIEYSLNATVPEKATRFRPSVRAISGAVRGDVWVDDTSLFFLKEDKYKKGEMYQNGRKVDFGDLTFQTNVRVPSSLRMNVDGIERSIYETSEQVSVISSSFEWRDLGIISLQEGQHVLSFNGTSVLDQMLLKSLNYVRKKKSPSINYEEVNPTRYVVHVNSSESFFLVFVESFDNQWKAFSGSEEFEHFIADSFINAYYIDKTGSFDISLEFTYQNIHEKALIISWLTIAFSFSVIVLPIKQIRQRFHLAQQFLKRRKKPQKTP